MVVTFYKGRVPPYRISQTRRSQPDPLVDTTGHLFYGENTMLRDEKFKKIEKELNQVDQSTTTTK